jgi:hypothetical protein
VGSAVGDILADIGAWFGWLTEQWWFWVLVVLVAIAVVIGLSILFWGAVIALTRWAFSTWRRGLVAAPVLATLVVLFILNFNPILQWVNFYWPLTMVPTVIVLALPLIMLWGLFSGGGSRSSSGSNGVCPRCGGPVAVCPHSLSSTNSSSSGPGYDMFSDPKNHSDLS